MIYQGLKPERLEKLLGKHDIPQKTFARLGGISDAMLSLFLSGEKGLSYEVQDDFLIAMEFVRELVAKSPAPVDFRKTDEIVALFQDFKAKRLESNVLRRGREGDSTIAE
jgi:transcriptional regulator with XRE-family HTH domain